MSDLHWDTKITQVTPTRIAVRGYSIDDLMGKASFAQAVWLVLMGEIPDDRLTRLLEAILVATIDHGPAPPSCLATRTVASTGASLSASVAAGVMCVNHHHGGAIEGCFWALHEALKLMRERGLSFDEAAESLLAEYAEYKEKGKRFPGFGHQLLESDPRTVRLLELCEELGFAGDFLRMLKAVDAAFEKSGQKMTLNIVGALGAVLGDLGVPPDLMNGFFMISRVPGLVAHAFEEMTDQRPMRKIHPTDYGYSGPRDRHLGG